MTEQTTPRKTILLIEDEELFPLFLQHFAVTDYQVLFAVGAAEAMMLCEAHSPALMVLPVEGPGQNLAIALSQARRESSPILGVCTSQAGGDAALEWLAETDQTVVADDPEQIIQAAREMLNERRARPRVNVEFPVRLGESGGGIAREVSASSVGIHTLEPLETGQRVSVEIGWGDSPYRFEANVLRVQQTALGPNAVVLEIPGDAVETREYLDKLVRRIMEVEHYLRGSESGVPAVRGPAAWKLARRAEQSIRQSRELQALTNVEVPKAATEFETRYNLGKVIARWGVGEVHEATHRLLDRPVWVKVLSDIVKDDPVARERFEQEAQVPSTLLHEGIIDVIDFGAATEGSLYYAMEQLRGETLADAMEGGREFSPLEVTRMGVRLAEALTYAHKQGLGHQDLCPANIFLVGDIEPQPAAPKLINFAGKVSSKQDAEAYAQGDAFFPPEAGDFPPEPSFDIFALGAVLNHVLQTGDAPAQDNEGTRRLKDALKKACAPNAEGRYLTMAELAEQLRECLRLLETALTVGEQPAAAPAVQHAGEVKEKAPVPVTESPKAEAQPAAEDVKRKSLIRKSTKQGLGRMPKIRPREAAKEPPALDHVAEKPGPAAEKTSPAEPARPAKPESGFKKTLLWMQPTDGQPAPADDARKLSPPAKAQFDEEETAVAPGRVSLKEKKGPPPRRPKKKGPPPRRLKKKGPPPRHVDTAEGLGPASTGAESQKPSHPVEEDKEPAAADKPDDSKALARLALKKKMVVIPGAEAEGKEAAEPAVAAGKKGAKPPSGAVTPSSIEALLDEELKLAPASEEESKPLDEETEGEVPSAAAVAVSPPDRSHRLKMVLGIGMFAVGVVVVAVAVVWGIMARSSRKAKKASTPAVAKRTPADRADSAVPSSSEMDASVKVDGGALTTVDAAAGGAPATVDAAAGGPDAAADGRPPDKAEADAEVSDDEGITDAGVGVQKITSRERRTAAVRRARGLIVQGRYSTARRYLDRALKFADSAGLRLLFAKTYERTGKYWPAIHHVRKAVALSPGSARYHYKLGVLFIKVGKRSNGCRAFKQTLRVSPGYRKAQRKLHLHCGGPKPRPARAR